MKVRLVLMLMWMTVVAWSWPADAQTGGSAGRPGTAAGPKGGGQPPRATDERAAGPNLVELVTLRMSQLEEDLQLQPAQMPAWIAFRERVQRLLDDRRRSPRTVATEATAPQRLDAIADAARNRLAAVEDVVDAGKAVYALLTPEQRTVADRRLALPLATLANNDARPEDRGIAGGRPPGATPASPATTRP
jgi:LTXXQ motif family protein